MVVEFWYEISTTQLQTLVVRRFILQKKDVMVVQPTGSGKSLCYQFPLFVTHEMTRVVTSTISLMADQPACLPKEFTQHSSGRLRKTYWLSIECIRESVMLCMWQLSVSPTLVVSCNILHQIYQGEKNRHWWSISCPELEFIQVHLIGPVNQLRSLRVK